MYGGFGNLAAVLYQNKCARDIAHQLMPLTDEIDVALGVASLLGRITVFCVSPPHVKVLEHTSTTATVDKQARAFNIQTNIRKAARLLSTQPRNATLSPYMGEVSEALQPWDADVPAHSRSWTSAEIGATAAAGVIFFAMLAAVIVLATRRNSRLSR